MPTTVRAAVCREFGAPLDDRGADARRSGSRRGAGSSSMRSPSATATSRTPTANGAATCPPSGATKPPDRSSRSATASGSRSANGSSSRSSVRAVSVPRCQRGAEVACEPSPSRSTWRRRSPMPTASSIDHGMRTAAFAEEVVVHASQIVPIDDEIPLGVGFTAGVRGHHRGRCGAQHGAGRARHRPWSCSAAAASA